jgi:predicted MFS family arabinose efflux permease
MGFLTGLSFALFNAIAGIPLARLADRHSRRTIIALGLVAWSILTAVQGSVRSYGMLALARIGVGVGEATTGPCAHSLISDYFRPERRATAIAVYTMGGHFGVLVGLALGGWLNDQFGWRLTLVALGVPGLLVALIVYLTVREPARGQSEGRSEEADVEHPSLREVFGYLLSQPSYRHLMMMAPLFVSAAYAINIWGPAFLIRVHGMSTTEVGLRMGLIVGIGGGAGTLLGGYLCDRLGARDVRWYVRLPAFGALGMIPFLLMFLLWPDPDIALLFLGPMVFVGSTYIAPMYALSQSLSKLRMRAMSSAVIHLMISIFAAGVMPQLVGVLNDLLAGSLGAEAIRYSLFILVPANLWGAAHAFMAARTLPQDLAAAAAADR